MIARLVAESYNQSGDGRIWVTARSVVGAFYVKLGFRLIPGTFNQYSLSPPAAENSLKAPRGKGKMPNFVGVMATPMTMTPNEDEAFTAHARAQIHREWRNSGTTEAQLERSEHIAVLFCHMVGEGLPDDEAHELLAAAVRNNSLVKLERRYLPEK